MKGDVERELQWIRARILWGVSTVFSEGAWRCGEQQRAAAMGPCRIIAILLLAFAAITARAAETPAAPAAVPLPAGGVMLLPEAALSSYNVLDVGRRYAAFTTVAGQEDRPFLRVSATAIPPQWWDVQLRWVAEAPIRKGDTVLLSLRMRTASAQTETGEAACNVCVQRTSPPWDSALNTDFRLGKEWQRIDLPFRAGEDYAIGAYQVALNLGFGVQAVDIADVLLLNYGQKLKPADLPRLRLTYPGREADAPWRKEAQKRIAEIRMADLGVHVTDAAGNPVPGATVEAKMKRHAFPFGTAVVAARLDPQENSSDSRKYREMVAGLFNRAVFEGEMNWVEWESARGRIADHKARLWRCIEWMEASGIDVRGHAMIWPGWTAGPWQIMPEDLRPLVEAKDEEKLRERIRGRITEIGTEFGGHLVDWDVVNEPTTNQVLQDVLGPQAMVEWFAWARRADPKAKLYINDHCILSGGAVDERRMDRFAQILQGLKDAGAAVDGIGEQAHFASSLVGPQRMLELLDRFSAYGWPIEITEFDQNSDDQQLQADYLRDFYTAAFSHPSISGIVMGGFWEGQHPAPDAALFGKDWSIKPNGQAFIDLTRKHWWTNEQGVSDEQGAFATRGFLGDYEITVTAKDGRKQTAKARLMRPGTTVLVKFQ